MTFSNNNNQVEKINRSLVHSLITPSLSLLYPLSLSLISSLPKTYLYSLSLESKLMEVTKSKFWQWKGKENIWGHIFCCHNVYMANIRFITPHGRVKLLKTLSLNGEIQIYDLVIDHQLVELYLLCHREQLYKVWAAPFSGKAFAILLTLMFTTKAGRYHFNVFGMTQICYGDLDKGFYP